MRSRFGAPTVLTLLVITTFASFGSTPARAASPDIAQVEDSAVSCLVRNYNSTIGLIHESPNSPALRNTYWLYSDNYLASLALSQSDSGNSTVATIVQSVTKNTEGYLTRLPSAVNQYLALETALYSFDNSSNYVVTTTRGAAIEVTLNNGTGTLSPNQYADVAFLEAISYARSGDMGSARTAWGDGNAVWDGRGFADQAYTDPESQSRHEYQTYKLALYVYASELTGEPYDSVAFNQLLKMQAMGGPGSGCFNTGYTSSLVNDTGVNTETTSLALLALSPVPCETTPSGTSGNVTVGTFLYLWYGFDQNSMKWTGGLGTSHWNTPDGTVVDEPSIGYYASDSNATLTWQLSNMQASGVSVIVVSWWGTGNATQSGDQAVLDSAINNATLNLFRYLESTESQWHFRVAIMVEGFNSTNYAMTPDDYAQVYGYLQNHYYGPYSDLIQHWQGKPLVMFFNTGSMNRLDEVPQNSTYTVKLVGGYPNDVDWYFWEGMNFLDASGGTNVNSSNYDRSPIISSDGEVGIAPRYDDYYLHEANPSIRTVYMRFDYNLSQGMYYSEWDYVIQNAKSVKLVLLDSWNEYHERTAIEPHADLTAGYFSGVGGTSCFVRLLNASGGGGGITEFPNLLLAVVVFTFVVVSAYVVTRRRGIRSARS